MLKILTVAATLAAIVLSGSAFSADLEKFDGPPKAGLASFLRFDQKGNCIEPVNWKTIEPYCPPGWQKVTAEVDDLYWKKCKTKSWFASMRLNGVRYCTQRFMEKRGTFCAPPGFTGRFWHKSPFNGHETSFRFKRVTPVAKQAKTE